MANRLETQFTRLLHRCETMASEKDHSGWRFEKYVDGLQDYLAHMRKASIRPPQETLSLYTKKVDFLRGIIETEKISSVSERAVAADFLTMAPTGLDTSPATRDLHHKTKARYQQDARSQLLQTQQTDEGPRKRTTAAGNETSSEEDWKMVIDQQEKKQQELADQMLMLTQNMKENARTAGRIVRDDTKTLAESNKLTDTNQAKLKVESERLESHVNRSCNWWIWVMLALVCAIFIWMVIFMRMFPKR